jgi:hypothetical protein
LVLRWPGRTWDGGIVVSRVSWPGWATRLHTQSCGRS